MQGPGRPPLSRLAAYRKAGGERLQMSGGPRAAGDVPQFVVNLAKRVRLQRVRRPYSSWPDVLHAPDKRAYARHSPAIAHISTVEANTGA